jgi:hypothetical protein
MDLSPFPRQSNESVLNAVSAYREGILRPRHLQLQQKTNFLIGP